MKIVSKIFFLMFLCSLSIASYSQVDQPCDGGDPIDCPEIPIDGGASLLIIAGATAGIARIVKNRKNNA